MFEQVKTETRDCGFCVNATILNEVYTFALPPSTLDCADSYNAYGYGLDGALPDYPRAIGVAQKSPPICGSVAGTTSGTLGG